MASGTKANLNDSGQLELLAAGVNKKAIISNGTSTWELWISNNDPQVTSIDAPAGSLCVYINTTSGRVDLLQKQDDGDSNNWHPFKDADDSSLHPFMFLI